MRNTDDRQSQITIGTAQKTAFALKLELALQRAYPSGFTEMLRAAGQLTALNGLPPESALIDIVSQKWKGWIQPSAVWFFKRAYWQHHTGTDPNAFFDIEAGPSAVIIRSKNIAGAHGEIWLHAKHAGDFFQAAIDNEVEQYERWATDPHPVGGRTRLLRMDPYWDDATECLSDVAPDEKGMLCIDPDHHPSEGRLFFGDPGQELQQLGALIQMQERVMDSLKIARLSDAQREEAASRAKDIIAKATICFIPTNGVCSCCERDVTPTLAAMHDGARVTGCPLCGYSWCE